MSRRKVINSPFIVITKCDYITPITKIYNSEKKKLVTHKNATDRYKLYEIKQSVLKKK